MWFVLLCEFNVSLSHRLDNGAPFEGLESYNGQTSYSLSSLGDDLVVGVRYNVTMIAENSIGRGEPSNSVEFTCKLCVCGGVHNTGMCVEGPTIQGCVWRGPQYRDVCGGVHNTGMCVEGSTIQGCVWRVPQYRDVCGGFHNTGMCVEGLTIQGCVWRG